MATVTRLKPVTGKLAREHAATLTLRAVPSAMIAHLRIDTASGVVMTVAKIYGKLNAVLEIVTVTRASELKAVGITAVKMNSVVL
jgi:hypothetical protein